MKSKLRKLADGGSPNPSMLGTGAAARAGGLASGLADGGTYLDAGYNANRYQQSQLKDGGRVKGPGGPTDDKVGPVMLSDEEYVLPGDTADAIGRDKLDKIRLATHEFKDDRKESALRKRADGGGWYDDMMPMDHLADGGNPWIVDPDGTVRGAPRAPTTAMTVPAPRSPAIHEQRPPPIDITPPGNRTPPPAQVVDPVTDVRPNTAWTRAGGIAKSALRSGVRGGAPLAILAGGMQSVDDANTGYDKHFRDSVGAESPLGSVAADAARVLSNVGDAALFGLPGRVGRGIAGAINGDGFGKGFMGPSDRDQYLQQQEQAQAQAQKTANAALPPAGVQPGVMSPLRSDQGSAQPVAPGSYQSRRLSEMGVPLDVQNSAPVVDSARNSTSDFLSTGGKAQYQNLGTYGGNGNIYGKADDPSRPGRINNFVGVGAGASPANAVGNVIQGPGAAAASALRGLGSDVVPPGAGGYVIGGEEDRFDKMLKAGVGKNRVNGLDWSQRHGLDVERARSTELANVRSDNTSRANAQLNAETMRSNAELAAQTHMFDTMSRMEKDRADIGARAQAAQQKAMQDARDIGDKRSEDNAKVFESVAKTFAEGDSAKESQYNELLATLPPEMHQVASGLRAEDKRAFYNNIMREQLGRNEGLVMGRSAEATVQNAALGGLLGSMTRFSAPGGKAVDKVLGKIPRVGPIVSALRPVERLTGVGSLLGAAAGAYATPEVENYTRYDPLARDSVTGAALPARKDLREALTYGAFSTYLDPFSNDVQTVSGRRTNKPTPDEEEAARRLRSALRDN